MLGSVAVFGPVSRVQDLSRSPDGQTVAAASSSGEVALVDASGGVLRVARLFPGALPVGSLAWSPDGRELVVSARGADRLLVVDPTSLTVIRELSTGTCGGSMGLVALADGRLVVAGATGLCAIGPTGEVTPIAAPTEGVFRLTPSPDGRLLAASGNLDRVLLFSLPDLRELARVPIHARTPAQVGFSDDSQSLVVPSTTGSAWVLRLDLIGRDAGGLLEEALRVQGLGMVDGDVVED